MINKKVTINFKTVVLASLLIGSATIGSPLSTEAAVGRYMKALTVYTAITVAVWETLESEKVQSSLLNSCKFPLSFLPLPLVMLFMPYYRTGK